MADDQRVDRRRIGEHRQCLVDGQRAVVGVPADSIKEAEPRAAVNFAEPHAGRPGERTARSRQRLMQGAQPLPDRGHRRRGVGLPPRRHRHLARQGAGDEPRSGLVSAVVQQPRNLREPPGPGEPRCLGTQVKPAARRRPLHELALVLTGDFEGDAASLVDPHWPRRPTAGQDHHARWNRHTRLRRTRRQPCPALLAHHLIMPDANPACIRRKAQREQQACRAELDEVLHNIGRSLDTLTGN
jgi:hypothetical protein